MAADDPKFIVRMPSDLKARVVEAARANGRSINAEIVYRLEQSVAPTENALTAAQAVIGNAQWLSVLVHEHIRREEALRARLREVAPEDPLAQPPVVPA